MVVSTSIYLVLTLYCDTAYKTYGGIGETGVFQQYLLPLLLFLTLNQGLTYCQNMIVNGLLQYYVGLAHTAQKYGGDAQFRFDAAANTFTVRIRLNLYAEMLG